MAPIGSKRPLAVGQNGKETPTKRRKAPANIPRSDGVGSIPVVKFEDMGEKTHNVLLKNRSMWSPRDLPPDCQHGFRFRFKPAIKDFVGTIGPWESPAERDIIRIWNVCFPRHRLHASGSLYAVVSKLVDDTIQYWRWTIATKAVECVDMYIKRSSDKPNGHVARAALLLGDDEKDRKRPFYYRQYENGTQPCGIFQSPIIAATLATHFSAISALPKESRLPDYPVGALALSVLAVKRALTWVKAGVESIPKTPEGNFSRANWGDHYQFEDGQYIFAKTASNIVTVIAKLRDVHWDRILAEANKYTTEKNVEAVLKGLREEEDQSDFELEDWDDNVE